MSTKHETKKNSLEQAIDQLHAQMYLLSGDSPEYTAMADNLSKLYKLREHNHSTKMPSADTLAVVAGNLVGIAMIVGYERTHVVTSKALSFVMKAR